MSLQFHYDPVMSVRRTLIPRHMPASREFDSLPLRWHVYRNLAERFPVLQRGPVWAWSVDLYVAAHTAHTERVAAIVNPDPMQVTGAGGVVIRS